MKTRLPTLIAIALLFATTSFAQRPARNISPAFHKNLANAQKLVTQAFDKVSAAQVVYLGDLGGHAQKAKELLQQANAEIKLAAEAANDPNK